MPSNISQSRAGSELLCTSSKVGVGCRIGRRCYFAGKIKDQLRFYEPWIDDANLVIVDVTTVLLHNVSIRLLSV
jgi:hypothetical protein